MFAELASMRTREDTAALESQIKALMAVAVALSVGRADLVASIAEQWIEPLREWARTDVPDSSGRHDGLHIATRGMVGQLLDALTERTE
jgi:hypothetical protein